jgi:uncharacterized protein
MEGHSRMTRANRLLELQQLDLKRDAHRLQLDRIERALRDSPAIAERRQAVTDAQARCALIEHDLRRQSLERDAMKEHLTAEEKKLFGGGVRAPKELQNLQREVTSLKRHLGEIDDVVLELMLGVDEAREAVTRAQHDLADLEARTSAERDAFAHKHQVVTDALSALDTARAAHAASITAPDLDLYERLRRSKGGRAVAELADGICTVCGMQLPRDEASRISAGERRLCAGCGRIVVG